MTELKKTLGPWMIWGLGVGYVISGMYFGWNLGLAEGGTYGLLVATLLVTLMYVTFVLSYAELACAIPRAGGAFDYAKRALNPELGFLAGVAQCVEFIFAPPAIAAAIGAYFSIFIPGFSPLAIAMVAYLIFTGLNIWGVKQSAIFELGITVLAVAELLIFAGVALPHFSWPAFSDNALPNGWAGILPAIPYAIWFYLAIEGVANVAEESSNPQKDIPRGFGSAMATLVFLALITFFSAVGVNGWEAIVYPNLSADPSDSPLPLALKLIVGESHVLYHMLIAIGLFGLVASFHGIILVAGRATFEFGRVGYAPKVIGSVLEKRRTPAVALILNMGIGMVALLTGKTGEIITMAVFGALTLYVVSMIAFFRLRQKEPGLTRPYRTPFYPWVPGVALVLALLALLAMAIYNPAVGLIYLALLAVSFLWFYLGIPKSVRETRI